MIIKTLIDNDFWLLTRIKGNTKTGGGTMISILPKEGINLDTVRAIGSRCCPDSCPHKKASGTRKTGTCYTYKRPGGQQGVLGGLSTALNEAIEVDTATWIRKTIAAATVTDFVRVGEYGDPSINEYVALPISAVLNQLIVLDIKYAAYTHNWMNVDILQGLAMASCESPEEVAVANSLGFKAVEVTTDRQAKKICPAQKVKGFTCAMCGLCNGNKVNVTIIKH